MSKLTSEYITGLLSFLDKFVVGESIPLGFPICNYRSLSYQPIRLGNISYKNEDNKIYPVKLSKVLL